MEILPKPFPTTYMEITVQKFWKDLSIQVWNVHHLAIPGRSSLSFYSVRASIVIRRKVRFLAFFDKQTVQLGSRSPIYKTLPMPFPRLPGWPFSSKSSGKNWIFEYCTLQSLACRRRQCSHDSSHEWSYNINIYHFLCLFPLSCFFLCSTLSCHDTITQD